MAVPLIRLEIQLLPWLSTQVPLSIPVPAFVGEPSKPYPWPFVGYRFLAGRPFAAARLSDDDRASLTLPLAAFLAALHAVPPDAARARGATGDLLDRLNVGRRLKVTRERLSALVHAGAIEDPGPIEAILEAAPDIPTPRSDAVVHGDLHAGQILVGDDGRLTGVLDWGDAHVGDPVVDLAAVRAILPQQSHAAFLNAYGPVDRERWSAAGARATWHTIAVLAHANETGDADMVREARGALDRLVRQSHRSRER